MKNNSITPGFILVDVTTVLSLVCAFLYKNALMQSQLTVPILIIAAIVGVCSIVLHVTAGNELANFVQVCHTVLIIVALGLSIAPMVNEFALVYAGLNPQTNLTGYNIFAEMTGVTWLVALVTSFMGVTKRAS